MPLRCGVNAFRGRLQRHADAMDAVSAYDVAEKAALEAVERHVTSFVKTLSCPDDQGCPTLTYDREGLRTSVSRLWGGPSPDLAGHYRIVVEAEYRFVALCAAAGPPPAPVADPPPMIDTDPGSSGLPSWMEQMVRIACQHFCRFKEAASDFRYCHVHITEAGLIPGTPGNRVTGVGHDDRTDVEDPHHTTVSRGGSCEFDTTTLGPLLKPPFPGLPALPSAPQPREYGEKHWLDIHFTELERGEPCPEGWFLHECECGTMCYTFLRPAFDVWYHNKHLPDLPPKKLRDELEKKWEDGQ